MANTPDLYDQPEEIIEQYVTRAFDQLVNSGRISLVDEPMEEHSEFGLVNEVAQELFEEEHSNDK